MTTNDHFYARPHFKWQTRNGSPLVIDGKLQPEIGSDGQPKVARWTLAIGTGKNATRLSSGVELKWRKFLRKRDAEAFIKESAL